MASISWRSSGLTALIIAAAMALGAAPAISQNALTTSFDHFSTGFPLTGAHLGVECTSCHVNGRFKGTPKQCSACHNTVAAQGKPLSHPQATNFCEGCHLTASWRDLRFIDHTQTNAPCANCHNGTIAIAKSANHLVTNLPCDSCHRSTISYAGATSVDHSQFTQPCAQCHDGASAIGKPANHVQTNLPCESCHKSTTTWTGAIFTHAATDTNCSSCHNGSGAVGMTTPPHVPVAGVECSNCHVNTAPSFVTYTMNHAAVSASRCDACHNGSFTAEGTKGAQGTASFPGHVATGGRDCVTCHTSAASTFTSWQGGSFTHAATDTNCSSCHNGTTATGMTTPPHIPTTGVQCSNCHTNTAASFTSYTMNHASVSASRCDACHNGSFTAEGTKGAQGTASFPGHVATGGRDCITCHASAASTFTSWQGGGFTHAATDTNCSSCHNGTTATGMVTPPHIPVTGVQCSNCHVNTAPSFTTYTMNHGSVSASRCDACHNGSYMAEGTKGAQGTASFPGHVATGGRDCITCHASAASTFTSWQGGGFVHAATDTNCSSCHNGTTATGMVTPPHIPVAGVQCGPTCHTNTAASFTTYTMGTAGHGVVSANRCDSCHNGSYTGEGTKGALGTASFPGHVATGGKDCVSCHASATATFTSWSGGVFTHAATDTNCSSCHNGTTATGMTTPPHIPTAAIQCSNCHTNTAASFTTYTMNHSSVSASRCDACHNGSYTSEGTKGAQGTASFPGHVATGGKDCVTCHASAASTFTSWTGGTFTHAATDTNCSSCHNGTTATGMVTPPHIPVAGVQCSNCHTNTAASFTTYTMNHSSVSASRCDACHNGSYTAEGTKGAQGTASFPGHVATAGKDCVTCHASAATTFTSWQGGVFTHAATDTNCSSCHNGTTATGMVTPPHIPAAGVQCSNCHTNTAASFTTYTMNHTSVSASRCDSCHNGSYISQGTKGAMGTASFAGHVPTNGADCITCHASAATTFTSWAGGAHVHAATDTNCSSCHNGTTATGMITPPHIPVAGIQCSNCHTNTAASFTTYTMSHTAVSASRCDSCHNGSYTGQGTSGAEAKASGHIPTAAADCVSCHASTVSFDSGGSSATCKMVHAVVTGVTCATCHNGVNAKGNHGSGPNCGQCHTARDTACGSYGVGTTTATTPTTTTTKPTTTTTTATTTTPTTTTTTPTTTTTKPTTTTTTTTTTPTTTTTLTKPAATSDTATTTTALTKPATTAATTTTAVPSATAATAGTAAATTAPANTAASSAATSSAARLPAAAPSTPTFGATAPTTATTTTTAPNAAAANATGVTAATPTTSAPGTSAVNGTLPTAATPNTTLSTAAPNPAASKLPTSATAAAQASPNTAATSAKPSHAGITSGCAACHNGIAALGKPPNHIVTSAPCENCHKSTVTFAGARMNHTGIITNCASCHNGTTAIGKPRNHIATNAPCETCHKSTVTFAGARVDHSRLTATCVSCHNGTTAEGKPPTHFNTTLPCETCHRTATWTLVTFRHTSPAFANHGPGVSCTSCHTSNAQTVPWKFPAYRPDCAGCHTDKYRPMSHVKFERPVKVYYTVAELRDCTGACHVYADNTQRTILTRRSGVHRAIGGGW